MLCMRKGAYFFLLILKILLGKFEMRCAMLCFVFTLMLIGYRGSTREKALSSIIEAFNNTLQHQFVEKK